MSFFKKLADFARKSNEKFFSDYNDSLEKEIKKFDAEDNAKVCANCAYYDIVHSYEYSFYEQTNFYEQASHCCRKHDFCFSRDDVETKRIQYHRTCDDFLRR